VLSLYKPNRKRLQLTNDQQMTSVYSALLCLLIAIALCYMGIAYINSGDWPLNFLSVPVEPVWDTISFKKGVPRAFYLFCIKFYMGVAQHLHIMPWFEQSLIIIKFVANHPGDFDKSYVAFMIGFIQFCLCPIFLTINSIGFMHRENPHAVIFNYFTSVIIVEMPSKYF
jgi:hypothetical protein